MAPTSLQEDTSEARTTKDEADAERRTSLAPSPLPRKQPSADCTIQLLTSIAANVLNRHSFPRSRNPRTQADPKPKPTSMAYLMDKFLRDKTGIYPTDCLDQAGLPAPRGCEGTGDAEMANPAKVISLRRRRRHFSHGGCHGNRDCHGLHPCFLAQTLLLVVELS